MAQTKKVIVKYLREPSFGSLAKILKNKQITEDEFKQYIGDVGLYLKFSDYDYEFSEPVGLVDNLTNKFHDVGDFRGVIQASPFILKYLDDAILYWIKEYKEFLYPDEILLVHQEYNSRRKYDCNEY